MAKFLDVLDRVEYLADLGVTAVQPLPIAEFPTAFSLGYNGVDYFSPEFDYAVPPSELPPYVARANALPITVPTPARMPRSSPLIGRSPACTP